MIVKLSTLAQFKTIQTNLSTCIVAAQSICARYERMVLATTNHRIPRSEIRG